MESDSSTNKNCKNCQHPIGAAEDYCGRCGQKHRLYKTPFYHIIRDFLGDTFSFDSKIFKSLLPLIFRPGRLTLAYFEGKRKSQIPPVRLFLFMTILFFALLSLGPLKIFDLEIQGEIPKFGKAELAIDETRHQMVLQIDSTVQGLKAQNEGEDWLPQLDSAFSPIIAYDPLAQDSLDTNLLTSQLGGYSLKCTKRELMSLTTDEILDKNQIEDTSVRWVWSKILRIIKDGNSFLHFMTNRISWVIFLMMPVFALVLKLLYLGRKRYYVEHLIFGLHIHSFLLLILSALLLLGPWLPEGKAVFVPILLMAYLYMAMLNFYGQGKGKTLLKYLFLLFSYTFIALFGFVSLILLSLALY